MAIEITIPKLGLTMKEATLVQWMVGAGDRVAEEQAICSIETDKVSLEMPAPAAGFLYPVAEPGRRVKVGETIGYVAGDASELQDLRARHEAVHIQPVPAAETPAPPLADAAPPRKAAPGGRIIASPAARKRAGALGVDLSTLRGSGPRGRIVLADVEKSAETAESGPPDGTVGVGTAATEADLLSVAETLPIRGVRKIISENMTLSLSSQAQLTLHTEASALGLRDTRALFNDRLEKGRKPVSYNAILVKAAACALRRHPMLNASVDGETINIWREIHIGVAMDFGKGLIVPKIRDADVKSIRNIADELAELAERARRQRLLPDELQGGTFTITNLGSWDVDWFTPINNFPESAILGVGRVVDKPWVRDGAVVAEPRVALSLTFDHRLIDGALGARFLKTLKNRIENTLLML